MPSPADRYLARHYAKHLERIDREAFAWLFDLVFEKPEAAEHAKDLVVRALKAYGKGKT